METVYESILGLDRGADRRGRRHAHRDHVSCSRSDYRSTHMKTYSSGGKSERRRRKKRRLFVMYDRFGSLCREKGVAFNWTRHGRDRILGTPELRRQLGV
jgi:hypothetical protein